MRVTNPTKLIACKTGAAAAAPVAGEIITPSLIAGHTAHKRFGNLKIYICR